MTKVTVERPSSSVAYNYYTVCNNGGSDDPAPQPVSLATIECFSRTAAGLTEGRLTDTENQRATIRVKIRPSFFIIETNKEYTVEEISTEALTKLIHKRTTAFKNNIRDFSSSPSAKRRKICTIVDDGRHLMAEKSVVGLETAAELLPVVINVTDWNLHNEEEIRFDLKGNEGMEELVNASHLDSENWELDRVTALILNNATGVFYARHNMVDIVVSKSQVTQQTLQHPTIFRLKNAKVWINTPLQLAFPSSTLENRKVLYQHPSLTKVEDLFKAMAEKSQTISALLIPGVTNFNPSELELLKKDGKQIHYFTAQCYFSKSDLELSVFLKELHQRYDDEKELTLTADEEEKTLAAFGTELDKISTAVSNDYIKRHKVTPTKTEKTNSAPVLFKRPVSCFFGPSFDSIVNCIYDEKCGVKMHLFPSLDTSQRRTFVVSSDNIIREIHKSGRFFNLTERVTGFMPDVDLETLKNLLISPFSHYAVASLLYYNNANIGHFLKGLTTDPRIPSLTDAIVELIAEVASFVEEQKLIRSAGEIARAVSLLYRLRDDSGCSTILFPDEQLMAERHNCNRPYYWHDPIRCVVGIYKAVIENIMAKNWQGVPVLRDDSLWTFLHVSVLNGVLIPFFDSVLRTGAWAIDEVRDFLKWILEDVLLKCTVSAEQNAALSVRQPVLDSVARLCVHWTVMQSAAENRGLCIAFPEEPPFIIEPGLSLDNFTLSNTAERILTGENVADRIGAVLKPATASCLRQQVKVVPLILPSGKFFRSGKDLTVLIVDPTGNVAKKTTTVERKGAIHYNAPRILSQPQAEDNNHVGFRSMKKSGVLTARYSICALNKSDDIDDDDFSVDGVLTGLSVDGHMEHVNLSLPGTSSTVREELPLNATKQGNYLIKDTGVEAVFFEPLLSSLILDNAANEKRVYFDSAKLHEEYLAPLRSGKIVIYPNNTSAAGPGFQWLWRVLHADVDKFIHPKPAVKRLCPSKGGAVEHLLLLAIKQLGSGLKKESKTVTGDSSKPNAFSPSFVEIDTFLKQLLKDVLSTLIIRMTMVVSKSEVEIIKSVCYHVANVILDSFYISLDPEQSMLSILERISGEQNGIYSDAEGFGFNISRLTGANILAGREGTGAAAATTSTLETLLSHLNSLERQQTDDTVKEQSEQMQKIRESSTFTSRLIKLIRDDEKSKRMNKMMSEAIKSHHRIPLYMISAMSKPAKPVFGSSRLPANEIPQSVNFSSAQYLYVPINPKHILTHMQWLECMSVIEAITRDSAKAVRHFEEVAGSTVEKLKSLLKQWNDIVEQVTSSTSPATLSQLHIEWIDKEANKIAALRNEAERSRVALAVHGKVVNIEKYGLIAMSRSLIDIDFYVKLPNSWPSGNWREVVQSAVSLASIPLQVNISKGIMAASKAAMVYDSSIPLSSTEKLLACL